MRALTGLFVSAVLCVAATARAQVATECTPLPFPQYSQSQAVQRWENDRRYQLTVMRPSSAEAKRVRYPTPCWL